MTTKVLTENQINGMKENGVTVICNGCGVEAAKDKTLPTTSWLISCKNEEKQWSDIVMGSRVAVFDSYYDAFGKNVIQRMDWTSGTVNPTSWNVAVKSPTKKKRRVREEILVPDINDPQQDLKNYTIDMSEMKKVVKKYKKMKKYMKSAMYEINKLSGKKTFIDKLVDKYGENPNSVTENT